MHYICALTSHDECIQYVLQKYTSQHKNGKKKLKSDIISSNELRRMLISYEKTDVSPTCHLVNKQLLLPSYKFPRFWGGKSELMVLGLLVLVSHTIKPFLFTKSKSHSIVLCASQVGSPYWQIVPLSEVICNCSLT